MRARISLWFWRGVWGGGLLIGLGLLLFYSWLPADGGTGDLESFTPQGFHVQWLLEERAGGLQVGDVIVRAEGYTLDEWLAGVPRETEWRSGETLTRGEAVTYEVLRDGRSLTLQIRLTPISFQVILSRWALQFISGAVFFSIGTLVFWKRPCDRAARVLMFFCVAVALQYWGDAYNFQFSTLLWRWPFWLHLAYEHGMYSLSIAAICYFALVFPVPHPVVRRRPCLVALVLYVVPLLIITGTMALSPGPSRALRIGSDVSWVMAMTQIGLAVCAGIRSIRLARDPVARAQVRWILWTASVGMVVLVPGYVAPLVLGVPPLFPHPVIMASITFLAISLAVTILRYHLFDIEVIINRSLVYVTLTVLLGGLYLLLVRLLTSLIQSVLHRQNSTLVVFIATLGIALAFAPLRRRIQTFIDRAFYRAKLDYQQLLPEMSARLATSIIPDDLAALLTLELPRRLQIAWASLVVLDLTGEHLVSIRDGGGGALSVDHPLVDYLRRMSQPLSRLQSPPSTPEAVRAFQEQHDVELSIPLIVGVKLVGLYNLGPKLSGDAYSHYEMSALYLLGQQAAIAVENSRLFQAEREQRILAEALQEAAKVVSSTLNFDQVLDHILEQVEHVVAGDAFNIMQIEEDRACVIRWRGYEQLGAAGRIAALSLPVADCSNLVEMRRTGKPIVIPDAAADKDWTALRSWEWLRSYVGAPIQVGGATVGFLNVDGTRPGQFDSADAQRLEAFASHAAAAIENAQLYHQVREHAEELTAALTRLQELDRLKSEFIQNVSHELRSPLALVRGYAELLISGELGELGADQQGPVSVIARRARMLSNLVKDITLVLEAEANLPQMEPVALDELAQTCVDDYEITTDQAGLTLCADIAPDLPLVSGSPTALRRVLDNLVGNAIKFTPKGGTITVRARQEGNHVVLEVSDTGIGIATDQLDRIFERFYQVDSSSKRQYGGMGLGLALVREVVEAHGGTVSVTSGLGEGSTFTVALPVILSAEDTQIVCHR